MEKRKKDIPKGIHTKSLNKKENYHFKMDNILSSLQGNVALGLILEMLGLYFLNNNENLLATIFILVGLYCLFTG